MLSVFLYVSVTQHKSQFSDLLSQVKRRLRDQQDQDMTPTSAADSGATKCHTSGAPKCHTSSRFQISDSDSDADLPGILAQVLTDSDDETPDQSLCDGVSRSPSGDVLDEILDDLDGDASDSEDMAPLNNKHDVGDTDDDSDVTVDDSVQVVTEEEQDGREEGSDVVMPDQNGKVSLLETSQMLQIQKKA